MEWLKKNWKTIAIFAIGILVLYWLYQKWQTNQANNSQNSQLQNEESADEAAYAQQIALANLEGGSGAVTSGQTTGSITSPSTTLSTSPTTPTTPTKTGAGSNTSTIPQSGLDAGTTASLSAGVPANLSDLQAGDTVGESALTDQGTAYWNAATGQWSYTPPSSASSSNTSPSLPTSTQPETGRIPSTVSTLFGSKTPFVSPGNTTISTPISTTPVSVTHSNIISTGEIEQHSTSLPTPTTNELASLGAHR